MLRLLRKSHPALLAMLAQLLAIALLFALHLGLALLGGHLGLWPAVLLQGLLAALLGHGLGLRGWWLPINLMFVPGLLLVQGYPLPAWLYLAIFLGLLLLNWNSLRERVPLYLSGRPTRDRLAELLAEREQPLRFIDLGCGLGGTLRQLGAAFPQSRFDGVETAPLAFALSWLRCAGRRNCRVAYRNLWQVDLGDYEVVYCFLSPAPMPELWLKARAQMRPGSWLVSNSFAIPGVEPQRIVELHDWRGTRLLLWQI